MDFRRWRYFYLCIVMLFGVVQLRADVTGSIRGYVRDTSGAVLPNATVTALQTGTGYTRTAVSDASGQYSLLALPPGTYQMTASNSGFQQGVIDNVILNVNDALNFDFTLQVGNVSQTVSVEASTLQVETVSTSLGSTITSSQILSMPLNGRSYLDLLSLQPGVAPANTNGSYSDRSPASGLYTSSGNVSTNGMPEFGNAFLVNGAEVNETKNMGAGMIPDADSVAEFRLITNSFSAEYGKFTGSVMNTVTKSGTNSFHGTLFEFYRNQKMAAINYFDSTKAELKRHQFGGVLGGPIWKDKLFTFTDYQQTRQVAGVSTGVVQVLSADERNGIFSDAILNTPVQGDAWAATLMSRGGGVINGAGGVCQPPACTPTMYNQLGTPVVTTDSTGASVPGHNISAYIDPVTKLTLPVVPTSNQAGGFNYDDSSHAGSIIDTNMAERIDFINHKTGDWAILLSLRRCDRGQARLQRQWRADSARLSNHRAVAEPVVHDEQHQDHRFDYGQRCAHLVLPQRDSHRKPGGQLVDFLLLKVRFQYGSGQRRPDQQRSNWIPIVSADPVLQHLCRRHQLAESLSA